MELTMHTKAEEMLGAGDYEKTLRIICPILDSNPSDVAAWVIVATAMYGLGEKEIAIKNLKSAALTYAQEQRPVQALAEIKKLEKLNEDASVMRKFAAMYSSSSERLIEAQISPPPIPPSGPVDSWSEDSFDKSAIIEKSKKALAVAWGQSIAVSDQENKLPYLPLFSALEEKDFITLASVLKLVELKSGEIIVKQGASSKAMYIVASGQVLVTKQLDRDDEKIELATLGPGAFFGEMALVSDTKRAAEVSAKEKTLLLMADKIEIENLADRVPQIGNVLIAFCHARMLENLMRISKVLAPIPASIRPDVIASFETAYHEKNDVIIKEGMEGEGLYLMVSGKVKVSKKDDGEDMVLSYLGSGDIFGEISLLMSKPSTATVTAIENTALLFLPKARFNEATDKFPRLLKGMYDIAMKRQTFNDSILASDAISEEDLVLI